MQKETFNSRITIKVLEVQLRIRKHPIIYLKSIYLYFPLFWKQNFSQNLSFLLVAEEPVPVGPVQLGVLGAVALTGAGVTIGTAVSPVTAAHRLQGGQRTEGQIY